MPFDSSWIHNLSSLWKWFESFTVCCYVSNKKIPSVVILECKRDWYNLPPLPDSGFLRTLDSSIKRNTAVIKKLKQINEEQKEGLMEELRNVNLSKFVSEAVTSICDAKLRTSDIQAAVQVAFKIASRIFFGCARVWIWFTSCGTCFLQTSDMSLGITFLVAG